MEDTVTHFPYVLHDSRRLCTVSYWVKFSFNLDALYFHSSTEVLQAAKLLQAASARKRSVPHSSTPLDSDWPSFRHPGSGS
jgi:predicted NAD-dependent protein-ADP-ribosyltransferase YbiA (DUF1768 family)